MKRRSALGFLSALCCSLTLPHSRALAQSDPSTSIPSNLSDDDRFVLRHVNNGEGNTPYSKLSSEGDFGAPEKSIIFSPQSDLHMNVWHPVKKGSARLIVFSHAEFLSPSSYTDLFKHWASHGFVVVAPLHNDEEILSVISSNSRRPQFHWPDYLTGELVKGDDGVDIPLKYWLERPSALKRVIDVIPLLQQVTGLDIIVDRPLIAGHSLGAFAAQIILGATAQSGPASSDHLSLADPRYYGGLILTPQGHGVMGLTISSWDKLESPLMVVTGPGDDSLFNMGNTPDDRTDAFALSPKNFKHLAWMRKTTMSSCTGEHSASTVGFEHQFQEICAATTGFMLAYGGYDEDILNVIAGTDFEKETDGRLQMMYR
ncbi:MULTISPECIES: alpha/beta hydrolase family protein [Acetobacter]|uniref:AB hydrolase-1 domain-containing protein n=3 Tax=Acetobacter TaxID=434 RepID=A0A401WXG7_ACEPA|nr:MULTISPECIES: hypothetical protein [Acetobacter]PHY94718.1 hypothetical protein CSR02_04795 [Acetobacter pomorum]GCD53974.1 hypothetical protein NBRC3188_2671 [Acetobacter pasteurianus NBRC 3188]GCD60147.1 hypothetical protein NBRC3277_2722 [Acetobacter pasteurianus NBRC 3277]GCD63668.1 hypothetical protein NBRC3278_2761 [Acetobacter pasteurianus NBRC 3278]GCD70089.1 hypothetical protein NBRC3280_2724 [Acetobacter pasteurianus NBRC 3280]